MEKLIKQAFLHESMCPRVDSGRYELLSLRDEIILPQLWSAWVKPGAYITMHMCRTPKEEQHKTTEKYDDSGKILLSFFHQHKLTLLLQISNLNLQPQQAQPHYPSPATAITSHGSCSCGTSLPASHMAP